VSLGLGRDKEHMYTKNNENEAHEKIVVPLRKGVRGKRGGDNFDLTGMTCLGGPRANLDSLKRREQKKHVRKTSAGELCGGERVMQRKFN